MVAFVASVVVWRIVAVHVPAAGALVYAQQPASAPSAGDPASPSLGIQKLAVIAVDYPEEGSIFPPEITPPTFLWRDTSKSASVWTIDVAFSDGAPDIQARSAGERLRIGEIDPRCVSATNELPRLTAQQAAAHTWVPDATTWATIKQRSTGHSATITITGFSDAHLDRAVSHGTVEIATSTDPVGAPIFFRDVPLMPAETEKGVIKPLAQRFLPLVAWRLRNISEPTSRLLMTDLHTCGNCHSFSRDGKTLGMDIDGPANDKGLYALASIQPEMAIRNQDVISWSAVQDEKVAPARVGFMSQVSPDGKYVLTMLRELQKDSYSYYVVNFKDYRFLQVFYPTKGTLAWYDRASGQKHPLPGADDPRYVQTDGVWSPDGKYVIFARAEAREPYNENLKLPEHANDPEETQIQYDLYRIPFNDGKGGQPVAIAGASHNGMSNTFPKVSPDGRWIVFVKCRNAQLMRPDSQLYIVPTAGGVARRMRCNTALMNSWHSFSPNGRWLVFSSKIRSPYTQMFLTHLDPEGNDSPPILIENATAANRAVNIPEFVNIPADGMTKIDVPAAESYRHFDMASDLVAKGQVDAGIAEWKAVLQLDPTNAKAHNNLGGALLRQGKFGEATEHFQKALEADSGLSQAQGNWGLALFWQGKLDDAMPHFQRAEELDSANAKFYEGFISNLGSLASNTPTDPKLKDAARPQAEAGTRKNGALEKQEKVSGRYRQTLKAVLDYIMANNDPVSLGQNEGDGVNPASRNETPNARVGASTDVTQTGNNHSDFESLVADLEIPRLRRIAAQEKNPDESFAAQRQILLIFLCTLDEANFLLAQHRNAQALAGFEIAAEAAPWNPYVYFDLARAQALNHQEKRALKTLQAAADKGYADIAQVERDRAFDGLRTEAAYQSALDQMHRLRR